AGVEKDEEKEVEYEENIPARIGKIVGETKDENNDNEANEDEEDNDDDDETIVDEEDDEKKEDVEELTKKSKDLDYACESWIKKVEGFRSREWRWKRAEDGDSKEQFDPGGFDRSGIIVEKDLEKANENAKKRLHHELVTPHYYITALRVYDIFVVVGMAQIYRTAIVIYYDIQDLRVAE
ncbi:35415_t:CDS:2, partial [Racocetra persica]